MKMLLCFLLSLFHLNLFAAEADHYSRPSKELAELTDAGPQVTRTAAQFLKAKLDEINQRASCEGMEEKELYLKLQDVFANHSKGTLVKDILYTEKYPLIKIPLNESIYGEWSVLNGFLLGRKKAAESPLALAPLMRINNVVIGTDKLEHLFGMGFQYFDRFYLQGKKMKRVLGRGIFYEKTILGGNVLATGVFAYADLAANFNGMRFWNHMLQKRDDVLGPEYNVGPYVACQNGKWEQVKDIDFSVYFDHSSDESINCSKFATRKGLKKYQDYLTNLETTCPRRPEILEDLLKKYDVATPGDKKARPLSHWILNLEGNGKVNYVNEF